MRTINLYATALFLIVIAAPAAVIVEDLSTINKIPSLFFSLALVFFGWVFYEKGRLVAIPMVVLAFVLLYAILISFFVEANIFSLIELVFLIVFTYAFYLKENINLDRFNVYCYFSGIIYSFYILFSMNYVDTTINYLRFTYFLPVVIIFAVVYAFNRKRIILNFMLLGFVTLLLMQYMGRYPIIFSFLVIVGYPIAISSMKYRVGLFIGLLAVLVRYSSEMLELLSSMSWFVRIMYWEDGLGSTRAGLYTEYATKFHEFYLTGYGVGNTSADLYSMVGQYPHNLFLHAISDLGVFGWLFCVILISQFMSAIMSFLKARKMSVMANNKDSMIALDCIFLIFLYIFVLFNKSASLYDIYPLIAIAILLKRGSLTVINNVSEKL